MAQTLLTRFKESPFSPWGLSRGTTSPLLDATPTCILALCTRKAATDSVLFSCTSHAQAWLNDVVLSLIQFRVSAVSVQWTHRLSSVGFRGGIPSLFWLQTAAPCSEQEPRPAREDLPPTIAPTSPKVLLNCKKTRFALILTIMINLSCHVIIIQPVQAAAHPGKEEKQADSRLIEVFLFTTCNIYPVSLNLYRCQHKYHLCILSFTASVCNLPGLHSSPPHPTAPWHADTRADETCHPSTDWSSHQGDFTSNLFMQCGT